MKKSSTLVLLIALFAGITVPAWSQAPSTEGTDFWVTFLQGNRNTSDPTTLTLTISALEACTVKIENPKTNDSYSMYVRDNSSTDVTTNDNLNMNNCYSTSSEQATYTALHVTSTKPISLFAGNYRKASFDATNVLPTAALLDDYIIQTYPASDHENNPQGSHFAIIAVEDGKTTVDYNLTAKTAGGNTGTQTVTLEKGQVWYVWTGENEGDASDLSGTTVKARDGKKIAVFQGAPHTNLPTLVRDRDHLISQAMPIAYWGTEFGITSSLNHRRDIVAVMATHDGTEVYINDADGEKQLVHTFDFTKDKKRYWTFEIGEEIAYCTDNNTTTFGKLPEPLVIDSSCYLTSSCPVGVHLFMVSNRYDEPTTAHNSQAINDPAMLWISPIEQVIKEINFSTYRTQQGKYHYMNILTLKSNVDDMVWTDNYGTKNNISQYFHPLNGNSDYAFARIEIDHGTHNLKGAAGFLAHVYGYGERESYAYSCGSSTVQRSISFNGIPLLLDEVNEQSFCLNEEIEMKLNIGSNNYESVTWDFDEGVTFTSEPGATNDEKKTAHYKFTTPGWHDLQVSANYVNSCTGVQYTENLQLSFLVVRPDTVRVDLTADEFPYDFNGIKTYTEFKKGTDTVQTDDCSTVYLVTFHKPCLNLKIKSDTIYHACRGYDIEIPYSQHQDGEAGQVWFVIGADTTDITDKLKHTAGQTDGTITLPMADSVPGEYKVKILVEDLNCQNTDGSNRIHESALLTIQIYYSKDIIKYKFNNVLAVYKPGYGGNKIDLNAADGVATNGWKFTAYEWYKDKTAIDATLNPTAATSVFHTSEPFALNETYYVVLTREDGSKLASCPFTIDEVPDYNPTTTQGNAAPAKKVMINQRIMIEKDNQTYNIYGQKVQ